jgi:hypothetical protein
MTFAEFLLTVLMAIQPWYKDQESWDDRQARMTLVAEAIDDASSRMTCSDKYAVPECKRKWAKSKKELAFLLVTKGWWESKFAKHVHEGNCGPDECDAIKKNGVTLAHAARSPWQIQNTGFVKKGEWEKINKADRAGTFTSANIAARALSAGLSRCDTIDGAIGSYGGIGCNWPGAAKRSAWYRKQLAKSEETFKTEMETRRKKVEEAAAAKAAAEAAAEAKRAAEEERAKAAPSEPKVVARSDG